MLLNITAGPSLCLPRPIGRKRDSVTGGHFDAFLSQMTLRCSQSRNRPPMNMLWAQGAAACRAVLEDEWKAGFLMSNGRQHFRGSLMSWNGFALNTWVRVYSVLNANVVTVFLNFFSHIRRGQINDLVLFLCLVLQAHRSWVFIRDTTVASTLSPH